MTRKHEEPTMVCSLCGQPKQRTGVVPGAYVREGVATLIRNEHPDWSPEGFICLSDLDHYRTRFVADSLRVERGELSALEEAVVQSMREQEVLSQDLNVEFDRKLRFGERIADKVAEFGGSWRFILAFGAVIVIWIMVNTAALLQQPFDPYPFILLNLVLSCLAALQAPIIMMSQNRQEAKDRLRAEHDYRVNLKAELEIRHLNAKMDELVVHQWQRLLEIQQIQVEMLEESVRQRPREEPG